MEEMDNIRKHSYEYWSYENRTKREDERTRFLFLGAIVAIFLAVVWASVLFATIIVPIAIWG